MKVLKMFSTIKGEDLYWQYHFIERLRDNYDANIVSLNDFEEIDSHVGLLSQLEKVVKSMDLVVYGELSKLSFEKYISKQPDGGLKPTASILFNLINQMLYTSMRSKSIGVRDQSRPTLTNKWGLYTVGRAIGLEVPNTFRLDSLSDEEIDFPVRVKPVHGCKGYNNFSLKSKKIDEIVKEIKHKLPEGEFDMGSYLLQEEYEPLGKTRSILRFLVCGEEVLHGIIYYTKSNSCNVNGATQLGSIPITKEYKPKDRIESELLKNYESVDIEAIKKQVKKVGQYGMYQGNPVYTVEFVVDGKTKRVGCIDVNMNFGFTKFGPIYFKSPQEYDEVVLARGIGNDIADSYMRQTLIK